MNTSEILNIIFNICIIPILGILTKWIIAFIQKKMEELGAKADNETAKKYYRMLADTISECVRATNQTYVETLKKEGKFDLEAQKKAFEMTKNAVLSILSTEAITYLTTIVDDFDLFVDQWIEANVNFYKTTP